MMKRVLFAVAATAALGCGGAQPSTPTTPATREMERLGVHTTGPITATPATLPLQLGDAQWGPKAEACRAGGYDLGSAAGTEVLLTRAEISQTCQGQPAMIWVVTRGESVICAYKTVTPDSSMAPGVWAVGDPACHD
jgi:hypothetical protein